MKSQQYIVLQATESRLRGAEHGFQEARPRVRGATISTERPLVTPEEIELSTPELNARERDDLRRDPRTIAFAQQMPVSLIQPRDQRDVEVDGQSDTSWGIQATGASTSSFDGSGVVVAVLDTGIDPDHPAFAGVELVQRNFTAEQPNDSHGHGTHCAGTIFGRDVDGLRIGIAGGVSKALIGKVLGSGGGSSATIADAILWAAQDGANVVSMSLGIDFPGFVDQLVRREDLPIPAATSIALEQYRANINLFNALAEQIEALSAIRQSSLLIAASGNESERPRYEVAVGPPAAATGILSVGALGRGANGFSIANFSNTQVSVSAPGVDIVSAAPGDRLVSMSGTSMATPHVAGITALWAQKLLDETGDVDVEELRSRLIGSCIRDTLERDAQSEDVGAGIVQAPG